MTQRNTSDPKSQTPAHCLSPNITEASHLQEHIKDIQHQSKNVQLVQVAPLHQLNSIYTLPHTIHIDPSSLISNRLPAPGKVPENNQLITLCQKLQLTKNTHIIAYDCEGGGWAGRLIWTLNLLNHNAWSYINGVVHANQVEHCLDSLLHFPEQNPHKINEDYSTHPTKTLNINSPVITSKDELLALLQEKTKNLVIWDTRSIEEYSGKIVRAQRGGHIPTAVHLDWLTLIDPKTKKIHKEASQILEEKGITPEKKIIMYCQTHHRSAFAYLLLKLLKYKDISAYDGSWSEWGNDPNTPVATSTALNT